MGIGITIGLGWILLASLGGAPDPVEPAAPVPARAEGPEWICTHGTSGVHVDPADLGPCTWVRVPSCPGGFPVYHHASNGLFGTCATTYPPGTRRAADDYASSPLGD